MKYINLALSSITNPCASVAVSQRYGFTKSTKNRMNMLFLRTTLIFFVSIFSTGSAVLSQEEGLSMDSQIAADSESSWLAFQSKSSEMIGDIWQSTKEGGVTLWVNTRGASVAAFDATYEGAAAAAGYVGDNFVIAQDVVTNWTAGQYAEFSSNHPEIAENMESFGNYITESSHVFFETSKDGALIAYEYASDGTKEAVDWTSDRIGQIEQLSACDIAEYNLLGGVAIGSLGTAAIATASTTATTLLVVETVAIPTAYGLTTIASGLAGAVTSVASAPAVPVAVTAAAVVGATVYVTSKGLCYLSDENADAKE